MKRIILSATLVALTAAMLALSSLASSAQEDGGQYASDGALQYAPSTTTAPQSTVICAPWSKAWDLSKGQWHFDWYRWCVDPSLHDPSVESSWYTENGNRVLGEQANLCPERGTCTFSPDGGMRMSTTKDPADTQPPTTPTTSPPSPTPTTNPADTQTPTAPADAATQTPTTSPTTTPTAAPIDTTQTPTSSP